MAEKINEGRKKRRAAALRYDPQKGGAPVIAAAGAGIVAEKIIEKAAESGIPMVKDEPLAATLTKLTPGDEIPEELYELVARIMLFIGDMDKKFAEIRSALR